MYLQGVGYIISNERHSFGRFRWFSDIILRKKVDKFHIVSML